MLVSSVVVDVDCDAAEGGDFGGELGEAGVVLSVGFGGLECVRSPAHGGTYCSRSYAADMMAVGCTCTEGRGLNCACRERSTSGMLAEAGYRNYTLD